MWEFVSMIGGLLVLMVILQLLEVPDLLGKWTKNRIPRDELEKKVQDLESRVVKIEEQLNKSET